MSTLRIVHIVNDSATGGAQTLIEQLAIHGSELFELHLLVLREPGVLAERIGRRVASIQHMGVNRHSNNIISIVRWLRRAIEDLDPDIVHTHLLHSDLCGLLSRGRHRPVVWTLHSTGYAGSDPLRTRVMSKVNGKLSRLVSAVVACTSQAYDFAISEGYNQSNLTIVANGIGLDEQRDADPKVLSDPRLVNIARWHPMKDHRTLFRAAKILSERYPALTIECYGDELVDENLEVARMLRETKAEEIIMLQGITQRPRQVLSQAVALVISSSYGEALPMVAIEALAAGVPVIATNVGAAESLVVAPWMLVEPSSPSSLADACSRLLSLDWEEYRALSTAARELAEGRYDIRTTLAGYLDVYHSAMHSRPRRRVTSPSAALGPVRRQGARLLAHRRPSGRRRAERAMPSVPDRREAS
jgi:glycosyltransferase involved in cell wall biosynthesis